MSAVEAPHVIVVNSQVFDQFTKEGERVARNIVRALNRTIAKARTESSKRVREQVAFSASYLSPSTGRLKVTQQATSEDMSAVITGRHRPTSLASFSRSPSVGKTGARVTVQPGLATYLPRAFFIGLRGGRDVDSPGNVGLAIRLLQGQRPGRAFKPKQIGDSLWLLYGPSVDQVFDDVADEISPEMAEYLGDEFLRLMEAGV